MNARAGTQPQSNPLVSVAFLPVELNGIAGQVCIVVDVLRASSTVVTLFARGAASVRVAPRIAAIRQHAGAPRGRLFLCGESGDGRRPDGFDANPSPSRLRDHDLTGREVLLCTTNGTSAMMAVRAARASCVFVGSLLNLRACAQEATAEAHRRGCGVTIVCAGRDDNRSLALDDAYCAGHLVAQLGAFASQGGAFDFHDSAVVARRFCESFAGAEQALRQSSSARVLEVIGDEADIAFCALLNAFDIVPQLEGGRWPVAVVEDESALVG